MNPISITRDGQQFGPFAPENVPAMIASGQLVATDLAWHAGLAEWQPLGTLPEFAHLFQQTAPVGAAPPQSDATARYLARREKARAKQHRSAPQEGVGEPRSRAKVVTVVLAVVLLLILGIGYGVVTFVFGSAVASVIKDNAMSDESFNTGLEYRVASYNRGFLKSTAEIGIIPPMAPPGDSGIPVLLEIYHGPLITGPGGTKPGAHRIIAKADRSKLPPDLPLQFAEDEIAQITFEADLSGNVHIEGFISGFSIDAPAPEPEESVDGFLEPIGVPESVTFSGATASFDTNSDFTFVTAQLEWGEVTTASGGGASKFHSSPVSLEADIPEIADGQIINGTVTFAAEQITLEDPGSLLKMSNIQLESVTVTRDGKLRDDFSVKLDNLTYNSEEFPLKIDGSANIAFGLRGVDTAALSRLQKATATIEDQVVAEVDEQTTSEIANAMADMLQPGLGISADFGIGSVGGDISLNLDLAFEGDRPGRELATLGEAINAIEATGRFRLAKSFLADDSLDEMIAEWQEEGIVADLGDKYSVTLSMRNGEPRLNGQVMPLPEFVQESLDEPIPWDALTSPMGSGGVDEPVMLDGPGDLGSPMSGTGDLTDTTLAPDGIPAPGEEEMVPAPEQEPADPDDLGIPYDPTASDEENRARAERMAEEAEQPEEEEMEEEMQEQ